MTAFEKVAGMFPSRELGEQVAREVLAEHARELAEQQLAFADQEDGQLTTLEAAAYVKGIRDGARRISPVGETEDPPEVVVRYDDGLTIRLRGTEVDADAATGRLEVTGWLTPGNSPWRAGDGIRLAYLGIPGRGALADITASVTVSTRLTVTHVRIRVTLDPEATT